MHKIILSLAAIAAFGTTAQAQTTERFQLEKTDSGYVRMNVQTGAISICTEDGSQLVCRASVNASEAATNDRLQARVDALEARLARIEQRMPAAQAVPTQQEFDEGLDRAESVFRRFMGIMREFDKPAEPQPNRT